MDPEYQEIVERIRENCELLFDGWREKVEYKTPVKYHTKECPDADTCDCPVHQEVRTRTVKRPGLLDQLKQYQQNRDADLNPKAARGAPRVKRPRLHPELNGFLTLDEITCDAYMLLDRIFEEADRDRTWLSQPIRAVLMGLPYQASLFAHERPDLARQVERATSRWVAKARATLRLTVEDAMFADTVCGNCGGGLSVAWDNSTEVRCVGSPEEPPCGETYPMEEWISLYDRQQKQRTQ